MHYSDYLREQAAKYRQLAEAAEDASHNISGSISSNGSLIASSAGPPRETPSFRHVQRFDNIESDAILGGLRPYPSRESCPLRWY